MSALLLSVATLPEFVQFFRKPGSLPAMAMELFINMHIEYVPCTMCFLIYREEYIVFCLFVKCFFFLHQP